MEEGEIKTQEVKLARVLVGMAIIGGLLFTGVLWLIIQRGVDPLVAKGLAAMLGLVTALGSFTGLRKRKTDCREATEAYKIQEHFGQAQDR